MALEVPLAVLALGWLGQRHYAALAGVEVPGDVLDHAALAGGVAALEQGQHALPAVLCPAGHVGQFQLHGFEQLFVLGALELGHGRSRVWMGRA